MLMCNIRHIAREFAVQRYTEQAEQGLFES